MAAFRRFANLFRRSRVDREIDAELQSHIALRIDDNLAAGMSPAAARRDALLRFGNPTATKERVASVDVNLSLETLVRDIRYATRQLRRSPGFTLTAIVTLALGIGANAVVFSLLNGLILHPINLPRAQRLYFIERGRDLSPTNSYPDYRDLRDRTRAFDGVVATDIDKSGLDIDGVTFPVWLYAASGNYFDVLGVQPYLGRFFHASDEHGPNSAPYIVLSYGYWQSHFNGDRTVAGRVVRLNKFSFTILGVAPPAFRGTELFFAPDLWAPMVNDSQLDYSDILTKRGARSMWLVGLLKPGVTPAQAFLDLNSIASYLSGTYPKDDDWNQLYNGASRAAGKYARRAGACLPCRTHAALRADSAGRVRQFGQPVFSARRRPLA